MKPQRVARTGVQRAAFAVEGCSGGVWCWKERVNGSLGVNTLLEQNVPAADHWQVLGPVVRSGDDV